MSAMSERIVIPVDGCELAGERWAGPPGGDLVVLLHEGVTDRRGWREVAGILASRARVVAYDRRGFGESPVSGSAFTHAEDAVSVLSRENAERAWLVGASAGGRVALDAALTAPGRVAGLVLLATAVSGAPDVALDEVLQGIDARLEEAYAAGDPAEVNRQEIRLWLDGPYSPEGRVGGAARELALDMNAIIIANGAPEAAGASGVDAWGRLAEVTVPVTVACGELDAGHLLDRSRELARRLPRARYVELPGVAHQPFLEQPAAVADLILAAMA